MELVLRATNEGGSYCHVLFLLIYSMRDPGVGEVSPLETQRPFSHAMRFNSFFSSPLPRFGPPIAQTGNDLYLSLIKRFVRVKSQEISPASCLELVPGNLALWVVPADV